MQCVCRNNRNRCVLIILILAQKKMLGKRSAYAVRMQEQSESLRFDNSHSCAKKKMLGKRSAYAVRMQEQSESLRFDNYHSCAKKKYTNKIKILARARKFYSFFYLVL